jgi:hypothetical protein
VDAAVDEAATAENLPEINLTSSYPCESFPAIILTLPYPYDDVPEINLASSYPCNLRRGFKLFVKSPAI